MIPEQSSFTCKIEWSGNIEDYDAFSRVHTIALPAGQTLLGGGAHKIQDPRQTNPEELYAASVATCMMMTILAVCSKSRIKVVAYEDEPEALLQLVERRYRITKVTLKPTITIKGEVEKDKLDNLLQKAHANCYITLSVSAEVVIVPTYVSVPATAQP